MINLAIQILPLNKERSEAYQIIDNCIQRIKASGLKYEVCPFETVIEGAYNEVMKLVEDVQEIAFMNGADDILVNIKIQRSKNKSVSIEDKIGKYRL